MPVELDLNFIEIRKVLRALLEPREFLEVQNQKMPSTQQKTDLCVMNIDFSHTSRSIGISSTCTVVLAS